MNCNFSHDVDFIDYLAAPRDERWSAFRVHYPQCVECSTMLSRLTAMEDDLKRVLDPALDAADALRNDFLSEHPSPSVLLGFLEGTLPGAQLAMTQQHLDACIDCRAEISAVRASEALLSKSTLEPARAESESAEVGWADRLSGWLVATPRWVPGLVAVSIAVSSYLLLVSGETPQPEPMRPKIAERPAPIPQSRPVPQGLPTLPDPDSAERGLALREGSGPAESSRRAASDVEAVPAPDSSTPEPDAARLAGEGTPRPPATDPEAPQPAIEAEREVILLAALDPAMIPGGDPTFRPWSHGPLPFDAGPSVTRSLDPAPNAASSRPRVTILAPRDAVALTHSPQPTLYWVLDRRSRRQVELSLTPVDGFEPILSRIVPPPIEAGLHALSLENEGIELETGIAYQWEVAIVEDPLRRDRDRSAKARVGVVASADVNAGLAAVPEEAAAHILASNGLWLDAFQAAEDLLERLPDSPRTARIRAALLEAAGHDEIARWLDE